MTDLDSRHEKSELVLGTLEEDYDSGSNSSCSDSESLSMAQSFGRSVTDVTSQAHGTLAHYLCNPIARSVLLLGLWVAIGWVGLDILVEESEQLDWTDTIYLMCQIITTVGYGDLSKPETTFELVFYTVYVLAACMLVAQIIGSLVGKVTEQKQEEGEHTKRPAWVAWVNPRFVAFAKALLVWLGFVSSWAVFFMFWPDEDFNCIEAIYMGVITLTTVGFGDYVPQTKGGKLFASLWMMTGTTAFASMIGKFGIWTFFLFNKMSVEKLDKKNLQKILETPAFKGVAEARTKAIGKLLEDFEAGKHFEATKEYSERISRNDFLMFMILDMQLMDVDMVDTLSTQFDELDVTGEGYIDQDDLQKAMEEEDRYDIPSLPTARNSEATIHSDRSCKRLGKPSPR